jgi:hypothetical protein
MIGEDDLRDCFAMFAMMGIVSRGIDDAIVEKVADNAYVMADAMLEARKGKTEAGIAGIGKRKYVRKDAS